MRRIAAICFCIIFSWSLTANNYEPFRDLIETIVENNSSVDIESIEEDLYALAEHPINLNTATEAQLQTLFWLTPEQIDAILLYVIYHPMQTVYELQLIPGFRDYEIQALLPFVCVLPTEPALSLADACARASHQITLRTDVRNLQSFQGDPLYTSLKYEMRAANKMSLGAVLKRLPAEIPNAHSRYGAFVEMHDIWRFQTIVAGDYRANFGLGLIMNASLPMGKSSYASSLGMSRNGLRKYSGVSTDFLRGAGATLRLQDFYLSAFYSCRIPDSLYKQTAGLNLLYRHNRLRVGLTAIEYWSADSLHLQKNYYNSSYFRGKQQFSGSAFVQYTTGSVTLMGEAAVSQNTRYGGALIAGLRWMPIENMQMLALARWFSASFDPVYGRTFAETSRCNDEHGIYLGADYSGLKHWRFSSFADFFAFKGPKYQIRDSLTWGYDVFAEAQYKPFSAVDLLIRARAKRKGVRDLYSFRMQAEYNFWRMSSLARCEANLCRIADGPLRIAAPMPYDASDDSISYGILLSEQLQYSAFRIPLVIQMRLQGFYIPDYNNRIYTYENDVLYAFSIPMNYGIGARYFLNLRWKINEHFSLYFRASDTWYSRKWVEEKALTAAHKTDVHLLLKTNF